MGIPEMTDPGEGGAGGIHSLPDELLSEVLALMGNARDVCVAACASQQLHRASEGAFRGLCHSTGRIAGGKSQDGRCSACPEGCPDCAGDGRWRHLYFSSTFSLAFNGMTSFLRLPKGALSYQRPGGDAEQAGLTVEVLFRLPREAASCGVPCPGGGVLLSASARPLGEATARKPGRTESLLYVARSGALGGGVGAGVGAPGAPPLNDDRWHRAALVLRPRAGRQELFADGRLVARASMGLEDAELAAVPHLLVGMPGVPGLAGGRAGGAAGPGAGHPLLGQVAEVRAWGRALGEVEVAGWAWRRAGRSAPGLLACWALQEGGGASCRDSGPRRLGGATLGGLPIPVPPPSPSELPLAPQWPGWAGEPLGREPPPPAGAGAWNLARGRPAWGLSTAPLAGEAAPM